MRELSLVAASGVHSSLQCVSLSLSRPLLLQSTGSRRTGSVVVAHRLSCSAACGIFPDQGSNPCSLHWQADSQPLRHQGSPHLVLIFCHIPLPGTRSNIKSGLLVHTCLCVKAEMKKKTVNRPDRRIPEIMSFKYILFGYLSPWAT